MNIQNRLKLMISKLNKKILSKEIFTNYFEIYNTFTQTHPHTGIH